MKLLSIIGKIMASPFELNGIQLFTTLLVASLIFILLWGLCILAAEIGVIKTVIGTLTFIAVFCLTAFTIGKRFDL